jgi:peptidoglycan/LPS O-acetylase OafA/YrhL
MGWLDRLGRVVTPGRRLIPQIDGLRFVAIAVVFYYHIGHRLALDGAGTGAPGRALGLVMGTGNYGVELFFVISGFVLALPFVRARLGGGKPVSLRAYYLRRLTRLEPPYLVFLIAAFLVEVALGAATGRGLLPHLLAGLIYQHNTIFGFLNPVLEVAWSLEVEVQFYVLTPLFLRVLLIGDRRARRLALLAVMLVFGGLRFVITDWRYYTSVLGHLHEFCAGYLLADLYVVCWKEQPGTSRAWDLGSLVAWSALPLLVRHQQHLYPLLPFVILLAYAAALRGRLSRRIFGNRWISSTGAMCYTIYLVHAELLRHLVAAGRRFVPALPLDQAFLLWSLVLTPIAYVFCATLFVLLERPCMNPAWPALLAARVRQLGRVRASEPPARTRLR